MSIDFNKPVKTDNYDTGLLASIRAHVVSLATWLDPSYAGTLSNTPTGARRLNGGALELYNGSSWVADPINGINLSGGNVGIGTASPSSKLSVLGGASANIFAQLSNGTQTFVAGISSGNIPTLGATSNHGLEIVTNNVARLGVENDGRVYGVALHNNSGSVAGTAKQYLASGTYTPGVAHSFHLTPSAYYTMMWSRVGNIVNVAGKLTLTTTSTGAVWMSFDLPIAVATWSDSSDLTGTAIVSGIGVVAMYGDTTYGNEARFAFTESATGARDVYVNFSYVVQ